LILKKISYFKICFTSNSQLKIIEPTLNIIISISSNWFVGSSKYRVGNIKLA